MASASCRLVVFAMMSGIASTCYGVIAGVSYAMGGHTGFSGPGEDLVSAQDATSVDQPFVVASLDKSLNLAAPGVDWVSHVFVSAGAGNLHVFAGGSAQASTSDAFLGVGAASVSASADWNDSIDVESGDTPVGTPILINSSLNFHGTFQAFADASPATLVEVDPKTHNGHFSHLSQSAASVKADIFGDGITVSGPGIAEGSSLVDGTGLNLSFGLPTSIPLVISARVGDPKFIRYELDVTGGFSVQSGELPGDSASADFLANIGQTLSWGGISSITDASTGRVLTDWTAKSGSGFDYSKPYTEVVPVPPSIVLWLSALAPLLRARHRRDGGQRTA